MLHVVSWLVGLQSTETGEEPKLQERREMERKKEIKKKKEKKKALVVCKTKFPLLCFHPMCFLAWPVFTLERLPCITYCCLQTKVCAGSLT